MAATSSDAYCRQTCRQTYYEAALYSLMEQQKFQLLDKNHKITSNTPPAWFKRGMGVAQLLKGAVEVESVARSPVDAAMGAAPVIDIPG
eukprot:560084-Amphidinium_carterae.1